MQCTQATYLFALVDIDELTVVVAQDDCQGINGSGHLATLYLIGHRGHQNKSMTRSNQVTYQGWIRTRSGDGAWQIEAAGRNKMRSKWTRIVRVELLKLVTLVPCKTLAK